MKSNSVESSVLNGSTETGYVEADSDVLGTNPAKIDVAPQPMTLTLLIPPSARP